MTTTSKIEWTEQTWNPVVGCTKISAGCKFCYAETMAKRLQAMGTPGYEHGFALRLLPERLSDPIKRRKPTMYFVNSMSDLFHEKVPEHYIDQVFAVIAATPQHSYQILTKRAARMARYFRHHEVPTNVWLGVSVENACASLQRTLIAQGYEPRIGRDIHLCNSAFESQVEPILQFIASKSPKAGRSIFLLDQYGYSEVPTAQIRRIFQTLPAAEVILTFNVDAFLTYASDSDTTKKTLGDIGIPDVLRGRTIEDIKRNERDWRLYIQSCLYRELVEACGARFYTLFFIRTEGHGDYWLVHLSQHPRARDVMARVHWSKNNNFIHYGGAGIDMFRALGYSAARDRDFTGQDAFGFCFDDHAGESSIGSLMTQLPQLIYARDDGLSFGELFATTCNLSPADSARYKEALERLVQHKEIEIVAPDGARRLKASTITDKDQLRPTAQKTFGF